MAAGEPTMSRLAVTVAVVTVSAGCFPVDGCSLPERPASLEQSGVRVGDGWLDRTVLYEDARLGSVIQIRRRPGTGDLAIVGTRAALFLPPRQGAPRLVQFRDEAHEVELLEWPGGGVRYLDRGGGGWQTGALIGEDGGHLWQPTAMSAAGSRRPTRASWRMPAVLRPVSAAATIWS
jgi:hypothetical protein